MKKPSRGVVIFGWLFLAGGILGLWSTLQYSGMYQNPIQFLMAVVSCITGIICGILILKLNTHAVKIAIGLAVYTIVVSVVSFLMPPSQAMLDQQRAVMAQKIKAEVPVEKQEKEIEKVGQTLMMMKDKRNPVMLFGLLVSLLPNLVIIYFFTRPDIRNQFQAKDLQSA
ncbi:MAG: hypothetical protein HQL24_03995 [Candidatus Omnitrophica bacterium]|nr:hypothetical protein [Candidatus Omnitrophota bacterium]